MSLCFKETQQELIRKSRKGVVRICKWGFIEGERPAHPLQIPTFVTKAKTWLHASLPIFPHYQRAKNNEKKKLLEADEKQNLLFQSKSINKVRLS